MQKFDAIYETLVVNEHRTGRSRKSQHPVRWCAVASIILSVPLPVSAKAVSTENGAIVQQYELSAEIAPDPELRRFSPGAVLPTMAEDEQYSQSYQMKVK